MDTAILSNSARTAGLGSPGDDPAEGADMLAWMATRALIEEAELTPKPALVDRRGSGAHTDMNVALMRHSALCLQPTFAAMALASWGRDPSQALREKLAETGRAGERRMLIATGGVNTHRGAIWTLGLLVASAAMGPRSPEVLAERAGRLARFNDREPPDPTSHGARMGCRFGVSGARGEAKQGFPHVIQLGLPALRAARAKMVMESHARLDALLAIMTDLNDTCLLYRGGLAALEIAKAGAGQVLSLGGTASAAGYSALLALDTKLIRHGVSPGGSADLLAATLFLDFVEHGDHSNLPWKN